MTEIRTTMSATPTPGTLATTTQSAVMYRLGGREYAMRTVPQCLSGETRYLTRDGVRTLADTVGTEQWVLAGKFVNSTPRRKEIGRGAWVKARIESFGQQRLYEITLSRNGIEKKIHATDGHRWFVRTSATWQSERTTMELPEAKWTDRDRLRPTGTLATLFPRSCLDRMLPSPIGVMAGFVYGDGTKRQHGCSVVLWGEKDAAVEPYFHPFMRRTPMVTSGARATGLPGVEIRDLPRSFKDRPDLNEAPSYLYGWLAGYFAADGSVDHNGVPTLSSADRSSLEFVRDVATRLGVGTFGIIETMRLGVGQEPTALHTMSLVAGTLVPDFFLVNEHRRRFEKRVAKQTFDRVGWSVISVQPTDRFEEVYCAVVPGYESFVLEDNIWTGNCKVCQSHSRIQIERALLKSYGYTAIWRSLPEKEQETLSVRNITEHAHKHLPVEESVRRAVVEARAREIGIDIAGSEVALVDHISFAKVGLQDVFERMQSGELQPDVKDGIAFANILLKVQEVGGEGVDDEALYDSFMAYLAAIESVCSPEQVQAIGRHIQSNPVMKGLWGRKESEPIDAEVVDEQVEEGL